MAPISAATKANAANTRIAFMAISSPLAERCGLSYLAADSTLDARSRPPRGI
jgi:hypothetical protein